MAHDKYIQALGGKVEPRANGNSAAGPTVVSNGQKYGLAALSAELVKLTSATEGDRNNQLNQSAFNLYQLVKAGHLDGTVADEVLWTAARQLGLPDTEVRKTLQSALRAAVARSIIVSGPDTPTGNELQLDELTAAGLPAAEHWDGLLPVSWTEVWDIEDMEIDWLLPDLFERGRLYALYAPAKTGKSLFMQYMAAKYANETGRTVTYIDHENTRKDLRVRFGSMGFTPETLANLKYYSFPAMPPLDTPQGGVMLANLVERDKSDLVVIDTVARVIKGGENDADTFKDLNRISLVALKAMGVTVVRLDHAGKDASRGQRGASGKNDDVDAVLRLERGELGRYTLWCDMQRSGNHEERLDLVMREDPLRFIPMQEALTLVDYEPPDARTPEDKINDRLDELGAPFDISNRSAELLLKARDGKVPRSLHLAAALRKRKATGAVSQDQLKITDGNTQGNTPQE